mmetsp:Transcript_72498/g.100518  ORF Transcript_72498/g.100518 Transcript_72498/m.100518 type:complete len:196 (+) Transcript_72498:158-745(+)
MGIAAGQRRRARLSHSSESASARFLSERAIPLMHVKHMQKAFFHSRDAGIHNSAPTLSCTSGCAAQSRTNPYLQDLNKRVLQVGHSTVYAFTRLERHVPLSASDRTAAGAVELAPKFSYFLANVLGEMICARTRAHPCANRRRRGLQSSFVDLLHEGVRTGVAVEHNAVKLRHDRKTEFGNELRDVVVEPLHEAP